MIYIAGVIVLSVIYTIMAVLIFDEFDRQYNGTEISMMILGLALKWPWLWIVRPIIKLFHPIHN